MSFLEFELFVFKSRDIIAELYTTTSFSPFIRMILFFIFLNMIVSIKKKIRI